MSLEEQLKNTEADVARLAERVVQLRGALQHLVNKSNRVTASERHGNTISEVDLENLYEAQLKAETVLVSGRAHPW